MKNIRTFSLSFKFHSLKSSYENKAVCIVKFEMEEFAHFVLPLLSPWDFDAFIKTFAGKPL